MSDQDHRKRRFVAVIAATCVSLACGTNYAYSAWGPQFADKLKLSATESNLVGSFGNVGMYASGIPFGHMVDTRGPRPGVALGGILIGTGYFLIKNAFDAGKGSASVSLLCLFSFLTGCGSCSAFQGAIKTSALNWPHHRGTATAFPLSAFGLSALLFVTLAGILFPDHDTSKFLILLAVGAFVLILGPLLFIQIPRPEQYQALANRESLDGGDRRDSNQMLRANKPHRAVQERTSTLDTASSSADAAVDETASLLSSESSGPGDLTKDPSNEHELRSHQVDVKGFALFRIPEFYLFFSLLGSLTGIGLMTINNIGHDAQSLWLHLDPKTDHKFLLRRQLFHVSLISLFSFAGRLLSGLGSDLLVKRLKTSRYWCLVASAGIFTLAQLAALSVRDPKYLVLVSGLTGLAYGALFGVAPAIVADAFGVSGLAMNWGIMMLGPVVFGNVFNVAYGRVLDRHSRIDEGGERRCELGLECYRDAYYITLAFSGVAVLVGLWGVWHDQREKRKRRDEAGGGVDEHLA